MASEILQVRFANGITGVLQETGMYYQCGYVWLDWALVPQGVLVDLWQASQGSFGAVG
jgi:hypothetical protein